MAGNHAGIGRGQQAGRHASGLLALGAALERNGNHAVVAQQVHERREIDVPNLHALATRRRVERGQVDHHGILVKKVGDVAEPRGEVAGKRGEVSGFEQQRDQGQVGAFYLEGGRRGGREGNGHG
jgi:hypothetical protein